MSRTPFGAISIVGVWACVVGLAGLAQAQPQPTQAKRPLVLAQAKAPSAVQRPSSWSGTIRVRRAAATAVILSGDRNRTHAQIEVTRPISANVYTLGDPYRAVIDVANLTFRLPASAGRRGKGIIASYRYGRFNAGRSRLVMDLAGPARIENATFIPPRGKNKGRLSFDLVRIPKSEFRAMAPPPPASVAKRSAALRLRDSHFENPTATSSAQRPPWWTHTNGPVRKRRRVVVVVDPGHGGVDPGAVTEQNLSEKQVVLAVAKKLRAILVRKKRYDVRLTRTKDEFVSLDRRVAISRKAGADLFISIHADALADAKLAQTISGASIYTLSNRASNEAARRLAEKENAADLLAGMASVPAAAEDHVRSILLDLVHRETADLSLSIRRLLTKQLRGKVPLARDPQRSAAFKVLKQASTPAVLIELGYMSNSKDLSRLTNRRWQSMAAKLIANAVDRFFASVRASGLR